MMKALTGFWSRHGRLVLLTFEVFWIAIFLLDRMSSNSGGGVPTFAYVNF